VPDAYRNPAQEPGGLDRAQQFSHMPPLRSRARNLAHLASECG
jgi:hypothetical protein